MNRSPYRLERCSETGAVYVTLSDAPVERTVSLSDLVMVDVDADGQPVGVEVI